MESRLLRLVSCMIIAFQLSAMYTSGLSSMVCTMYTQIEINRKRETELNQLRSDMDTQNEEHEKSVADLKKKHTNAIAELEEQVENLQKSKNKLEKDVHRLNAESGDLGGQLDDTQKAKVHVAAKFCDILCMHIIYYKISPETL